jgi:hypothetical protein
MGDKTMKGRTCRTIALDMLAQKTANAISQKIGPSKTDTSLLQTAAEDVALTTRNLKVTSAANPNRLNLTQINQPNQKLKPTPKALKTNHNSQPTRDNARVLRIVKMGSLLRRNLLTTRSDRYVMVKSEAPNEKVPKEG